MSESGGGGSICGVLLSLAFSLSGVLSTVSSLTILSSSDEDSVIQINQRGGHSKPCLSMKCECENA